ncbi:LutC/YkgG family protein [Cohaesibacter celericrescens]|uniref:Lactate utilization protein n=1 Tax=Cohaesibacter celericrescens TaxID=2067669 RepID=A0A2N5XKP0_9HYPH|nr:lactate utilization protein [Cohaesibacter celericrescens]PLW74997.1 lactate utilization protein [Cohaesibacter celericrescens]
MSDIRDSSAAKSAILNKIRRSLGGSASNGDRSIEREEVTHRLERKERGILPARGQVGREERIKLFLDYAEKVSSTTNRVASYDALPSEIANYLRGRNLPQKIRTGQDQRLAGIDWSTEPQLERLIGPSDGTDLVGVSHALGGVAETGTALFASGPDNPTTLNFLPETHIIVVHADDIHADYESVQDKLRGEDGEAVMPRVVNMITGPSRSGDIEQTILLGAHGPRDVHVIVVG